LKNTILLCLAVLVFWLGKALTLILIYASPDNIAHVFDASIYYLGSSIFIFSLYSNLDNSLHVVFKWLFGIFGVYSIFDSILFISIAIHTNPNNVGGAITFTISTLFFTAGLLLMLKTIDRRLLMNKYSTLLLSILLIMGTFLALMPLYASSDGLQHPLTASLYFLVTSLVMMFVVIKYSNEIKNKILIIAIFTIESVPLALICLYSLEPESRVESLASSIFFFSGMLASSSIFFASSKVKNSNMLCKNSEE